MSDRFSKFSLVGFVAFGILIVAVLYWVGSINEQHSTVAKAVSVPNLLSSSALRIFLPKESQAKCLDGSSPAYYLRHGSGSGKNKWIILFEGGGWCYDKEQCYHRSKTVLGSSKHYPQYISADHMNFYISQAADANPLMYNWNTVLVRYCDGSSFAGNSEMKYQGQTLHFKGMINRDETIRSLFAIPTEEQFRTTVHGVSTEVTAHTSNLRTAEEVVVAGCSAGALGVLLGLDQMADLVRNTAAAHGNHNVSVRGLVDSGYFMAHTSSFVGVETHNWFGKDDAVTATTKRVGGNSFINYPLAMRDVFQFANISAGAHPACVAHHKKQQHSTSGGNDSSSVAAVLAEFGPESECIFAANLVPHIRTPVFLLQPQYDQWQILHIYSQAYTAEGVNAYGKALVRSLTAALFHPAHPGHGVFLDSCSHHCTSCSDPAENSWSGSRVVATVNASTQQMQKHWNEAEAFQHWYQLSLTAGTGKSHPPPQPGVNWFYQDRPYPCSDCCMCSVDMVAQLRRNYPH